jgi:Flp pilus assembly protein TadG
MTVRDMVSKIKTRRLLARFAQDRSGAMVVVYALSAMVMLLAIGAAVDFGRWLHARDQTASAIDSAVLAGARYLQTNSTDTAGAVNAAKKFYAQNVASRIPVTDDSINFAVSSDGTAMSASGTAYIQTPFLQLANIDKLPLFKAATAKAERQVGNKEVAVMLDITGSMCDNIYYQPCSSASKLNALKAAANKMIDIMLPEGQTNPSAKVAIIPFSEEVRLPTTAALNAARGTGLSTCERLYNGTKYSCSQTKSGSTDYYLAPCVVERTGANKYTDAAPGSGSYSLGRYSATTTGSGSNKVGVCTLPSGAEVQPLTNDRTTLINKINGLSASGGTAGQVGTAWAWYTLSPNFSSLWSSNAPQAYGAKDLRKIAVLMTDGDYNTVYDANGVIAKAPTTTSVCGTPSTADADAGSAANGACSGTQALSLCTAMKAKGIEVYTIGFNIGNSSTPAYQLLSQCATDTTKFYAPVTNDQLLQAFTDIGLKISNLYLSQ